MSISSRKSFEGGLNMSWKSMIYKTSTNDISIALQASTPPIYHQGSQDMGNRIANCSDYADPKTLFPNAGNILINKNSLHQRDSVVSSSSDSIIDPTKHLQHNPDPFSDSYYEDTAESLLENDFRDSAIYSDDSNEKKSDATLSADDHIYATVNKSINKPMIPPKIPPKKPSLLIKPSISVRSLSSPTFNCLNLSLHQNPPVPLKPSNLKSPEMRNAIRKKNAEALMKSPSISPPPQTPSANDSSWVKQQAMKFQ
jgi:hypothetical protein